MDDHTLVKLLMLSPDARIRAFRHRDQIIQILGAGSRDRLKRRYIGEYRLDNYEAEGVGAEFQTFIFTKATTTRRSSGQLAIPPQGNGNGKKGDAKS